MRKEEQGPLTLNRTIVHGFQSDDGIVKYKCAPYLAEPHEGTDSFEEKR